jgi:hypothetical protein
MGLPQRFWDKVEFIGEGGCWLWTGCILQNGYGQFSVGGHPRYVHRLAYENLATPIPEGLTIDHLCRVRRCVNPDHLEPVTSRENTLRSPTAPTAVNARKTHCLRGHPLSGANLYEPPSRPGRRYCRECVRMRKRVSN